MKRITHSPSICMMYFQKNMGLIPRNCRQNGHTRSVNTTTKMTSTPTKDPMPSSRKPFTMIPRTHDSPRGVHNPRQPMPPSRKPLHDDAPYSWCPWRCIKYRRSIPPSRETTMMTSCTRDAPEDTQKSRRNTKSTPRVCGLDKIRSFLKQIGKNDTEECQKFDSTDDMHWYKTWE